MFSKLFIVSAAAVIAAANAGSNPYATQCNPADCPDMSTQCYNCDVRADPLCILSEGVGVGFCIEPVPLSQKKSYNQKYPERCRRAKDPNGGNILPPEAYVKACREFEYTCNDGTCEQVKGLPSVCKKNIVEAGSGKCDPDDPDLQAKIPSLWETKYTEAKLAKVCENHGGVKYDYLRCDSQFTFGGVSQDCNADSPYKVDVSACTSDPPDVSTEEYECSLTEVTASTETCCLVDEVPGTCRPLIQAGPGIPDAKVAGSNIPTTGGLNNSPASGIIFEMTIEPTQERCCCKQSCNCFGDPHCDSLFGNYEISRGDGGFLMFGDNDFEVYVEIGEPGGVILSTDITMSTGDKYTIAADLCKELDDVPVIDPLPTGWKFKPGSGRAVSTQYEISDADTQTVVVVTCILFDQNVGPNKGEHTRLDVEVLKNVPLVSGDDALCCPSPEEVYSILHPGTDGFCATENGDDPVLPDDRRRLDDDFTMLTESPTPSPTNHPTYMTDSETKLTRTQAEKLCDSLIGKCDDSCCVYSSCMTLTWETKLGDCVERKEELFKSLRSKWVSRSSSPLSRAAKFASCHSFASDPVFHPDNQEQCARGVQFQVKPKNGNAWETVYFFPEEVEFCNGQVKILFEHIQVNGEPFDFEKHDVQFVTCSATEECAFECLPEVNISSMKASFMYPCESAAAKDEFLQHAFTMCDSCNQFKECLQSCLESGDCGCST